MAPNKASDVSAADWLSQTHVKNYGYFSRVVIGFFSMVEIPIKHFSLYDKKKIARLGFESADFPAMNKPTFN